MKRSLPLTRMAIIGDFSPIYATILFLAIFNSLMYFDKIILLENCDFIATIQKKKKETRKKIHFSQEGHKYCLVTVLWPKAQIL